MTLFGQSLSPPKLIGIFSLIFLSILYLRIENQENLFLWRKQLDEDSIVSKNVTTHSSSSIVSKRNLQLDTVILDACGSDPNSLTTIKKDERESGVADVNEMKSTYRNSDLTWRLIKSGKLQKMDFQDPETAEWLDSTIRIAVPWAFFLVVTLLSCPFYYCYCCDCCPCCQGCRQQGYYKGMETKWPPAIALVGLILLFAVAIYGIFNKKELEDSVHRFRCVGVNSITQFIVGDTGNGWIGLDPFKSRMNDLGASLDNFFVNIDATFGPRDWITQDPDAFKSKTETTGNRKVSYTKNPKDGSTIALNSPFIDKQFSGDGWKNDAVKYMGSIYNGLVPALDLVSKSLLTVNEQGLNLKNDGKNFKTQVNDGIQSIDDVIKTIKDGRNSLDSNLKTADQNIQDSFTGTYADQFYGIIGLSVLTSLVLLFMILTGKRAPRICLHFAWMLFYIYTITFLIIATVGIPFSVIMMQVCEGMKLSLNVSGELASIKDIDKDLVNRITTCTAQLGGTGDIISTFDVKQQLDQVLELRVTLNAAFESTDMTNPDSPLSTLEKNQILITQSYLAVQSIIKMGIDTTERGKANAVQEDPNVPLAVDSLNQFTQKANRAGSNSCSNSGTNDQWVQDISTCQAGYQKVDQIEIDTQVDSCVPVDIYAVGPIISVSDRYPSSATSFPSCSNFATIQSTYENLLRNINQRYSQFIVISNQLSTNSDSILKTFQGFLSQVKDYDQSLTDFQTGANTILDQFDSSTEQEPNSTYILKDMSCIFLGQNLVNIHEAMCYLILPAVFQISKIGIVIGIGAFLATFFIFLTAIRYYQNSEFEEINKLQNVDDRGNPLPAKGEAYTTNAEQAQQLA